MTSPRHWRLERDGDGLHWLYFDKAGESTNTFSAEAMMELRAIVGELQSAAGDARARGLVVLSAKDSGFIAGADVREFTAITSPAEAVTLVATPEQAGILRRSLRLLTPPRIRSPLEVAR